MNRVIVIVASGLALAGCTSAERVRDWLPKFEPKPVDVQFQSQPAGRGSQDLHRTELPDPLLDRRCRRTRISQVTFSLAGYQPQTISVQPTKSEETVAKRRLQPNPVEVELVAHRPRRSVRQRARRQPATAARYRRTACAAARPARSRGRCRSQRLPRRRRPRIPGRTSAKLRSAQFC